MTDSEGRGSGPTPQTHPPAGEPVDWDDDTIPGMDVDEHSFDRVTAIPELPSELFAKKMMEAAPGSVDPDPISGLYQLKVPGPPPAPSLTPSIAPFELEQALFSVPALSPRAQIPPRSAGDASTAPPPRQGPSDEPGHAPAPPLLELDLRGLETSLPPSADPELRALSDRYAIGDYSGALVVAEGILEANPEHVEAARYANNCREVLMQMYSGRLGSLNQVVSMAIPAEQIRWLSLDHRSGFLLSLVDGTSSIEEIFDMSGMPRLDALRIMFSLFSERVVALSPR